MDNNIRLIREQKGLTQGELAESAGIGRPYLSRVENGKYNPGICLLLRIAQALECKVDDLVSSSGRIEIIQGGRS